MNYFLSLTNNPQDDCDCLEEKIQKAGKLILNLLDEIENMQDKKHHRRHRKQTSNELESDEELDDCEIQEKIMGKAQDIFMKWVSGKNKFHNK